MTWQANWVQKQKSFEKSRRLLEIGSGAFETTLALAQRHPNKEFYGIDFVLSPKALEVLKETPPNLTVIKHDARNLKMFADGYFDCIYSIAVMEHIKELDLHLNEAWRVLRPGGGYFFWQAPFWSCSRGHHYMHGSKDCPIPPYAHLHMTRYELRVLLEGRGLNEQQAQAATDFIYDRGDLSRLSRTKTRDIINRSNFSVEEWGDDPDDQYDEEGVARVLARNLYDIAEDDLRYKGARVSMRKAKTGSGDLAGRVKKFFVRKPSESEN